MAGGARRSIARYGFAYATLYLGTGIATPYVPLWFGSIGLGGSEIGVILAAPMLARVASGPLVAMWADRFRLRRTPIVILASIASIAFAFLLVCREFLPVFLLWFIGATALGACSPLVDIIVLRRTRVEGFSYGAARGIGSAAYVVGNVAVGFLLKMTAASIAVAGAAASAFLSAVALRTLLPSDKVDAFLTRGRSESRLSALARNRLFITVILSAGLIQASNAFYYGFSALLWRSQGIDHDIIGLLWGSGVAVEVAFLWFCEPFRRRVGPETILLISAIAAAARWSILAFSPPLWLLWPVQASHALTLSAPFVASLQLVERVTPAHSASAAQQINAALAAGLFMGLATIVSGFGYEHWGAGAYVVMTVLALLALPGAIQLRVLAGSGAEVALQSQKFDPSNGPRT